MPTRPAEIALLVNPSAGRGKGERFAKVAAPRLREAGFDVRTMTGADGAEAESLARQAVAEGCAVLAACGGDGLVHLAAQALAGTDTALGIIPAGTGNDVARYLGISRTDPRAAVDTIVASRRRRIDLARSGERHFVTVLAAGFDAIVNERANAMTWPRGQMRYNLATIAELRTFTPIHYTVELDGETRQLEAMLVAIGNGPSFGGGLRITEGALLDDGLLDVVIIKPMSRPQLVRTYPRLFNGTHTTHPAYEHHRVRRVTLAAHNIVTYADGERFGALPLTVESAPLALTVMA